MENKYKVVQASEEEIGAFNTDFQELLEKHSLIAETQPQISRIGETGDFCIKGVLVLSKKVETVEVVQEGAVKSDNPEVNPTIQNESIKEN